MNQSSNAYRTAQLGKEFAWPWLDLANSLEWNGFGERTDHLKNPAWLPRFLKHWNFAQTLHCPAPVAELVSLRSLLRRMAGKITSGNPVDARDLATLNSHLNVPVRVRLFQRQNGVQSELVPLHPGWPWILSRIAASFGETLALNRNDRLKFCPNDGCRWVFFDQTKGNTRRWCNDRTCGNRDRVRRSRARSRKTSSKTKSN